MRQRSFEIVRYPELVGASFLINNVRVRYVGTCPETGISFYINNGEGGVFGIRVYPDERKVVVNPDKVDWKNKHGKAVYLQFRDAFGTHKGIPASHAVYIAWTGKDIAPGMTIDHINGCTTNNHISNLRCIEIKINMRDGGFLSMLRNRGFNPQIIDRSFLLRYYHRMSIIKPNISQRRYNKLTYGDLFDVLFANDEEFSILNSQFSNRKRHAKRS